jgi:hypothetical protein
MNLTEQLRIDAEQIAMVGGDRKAIAKCLLQAADRIAKLEARLDAVAKCQAFTAENFGRNTMVLLAEEVHEALEQKEEARDEPCAHIYRTTTDGLYLKCIHCGEARER